MNEDDQEDPHRRMLAFFRIQHQIHKLLVNDLRHFLGLGKALTPLEKGRCLNLWFLIFFVNFPSLEDAADG